jgi:hypothetical protein
MAFRIFIGLMWLSLTGYTAMVISRDGLNLLPVFFGAISDGHWQGQFNADFMTFLALSALWTAWRSGFSASGVVLGVVAFFLGGGFLLPFLVYLSFKHRGTPSNMLLGIHANKGNPQ